VINFIQVLPLGLTVQFI